MFIFKNIERPTRDDVYDALKEMKIDAANVKAMIKRGSKGYTIDFNDTTWKKHIISTVNKYYSDEYKVFSCVEEDTKVTVSGVPVHFDDTDVLEFLEIFGDFDPNLDNVTHRFDKNGAHTGERVYSAKKIKIDIPSFWWIYGHQLTFRYHNQPHTCRLCGKRGHHASECPISVENQEQITVEMEIQEDHNKSSQNTARQSSVQTFADRVAANANLRPQVPEGQKKQRQLQKTWGDGGYAPNGRKPKFVNQRPGTTVLGDYFSNANKQTVLKKNGKPVQRVVIVKKSKVQIEKEKLLKDVNDKIFHVQRIVADNNFSDGDEEKEVAKEVHKTMVELRNLADADDEYKPVVDGSPEAIRRLLEYDIELLSGCSERIGASCGARLRSPAFQSIINKFIAGLESREKSLDTVNGSS